MRFQLTGMVARTERLTALAAGVPRARLVSLDGQYSLLPVTRTFLMAMPGVASGPVEGFRHLNLALADHGSVASMRGEVAYIEAEFVGGMGAQSSICWTEGAVALGPLHCSHHDRRVPAIGEWPINRALRFLGVAATAGRDEFDTLGLGRHHRVEDWVEAPPVRYPRRARVAVGQA